MAIVVAACLPAMESAKALSGSQFQAGNIISNGVFQNTMTMSAQDIQGFLNAKVTSCDTNGTQLTTRSNGSGGYYTRAQWGAMNGNPAPFTCLKDYSENGISAAQIIWNAAQQHQINPQVILVTLQKEQGLITDDWPWASQLRYAMGYGCPDTSDGCNATYSGFARQVDSAAWQFRYYLDHPYAFNFWVGNYDVAYNPNPGCGRANVNIQNAATAALYIYTPYQPNPAALNNLTGTGDGCSAYGNRNFWYYFSTWFGSTQTSTPYAWLVAGQGAFANSARTQPFTNPYAINVAPGQTAYLSVTARNIGYKTWDKQTVKLGTSKPIDRTSSFADGSWASGARITMSDDNVPPGSTTTFNFSIKAPAKLGTYNEYFNLVAEYQTWFIDYGLYFTINVVNPREPVNSQRTGLASGESLNVNQYLLSPDAHSVFILQPDGNLVLYSDFLPRWANYAGNTKVNKLIMQTDGNLVEYDKNGVPIWNTETAGNPGAYLATQPDGNVVVYASNNTPLWASSSVNTPNHLSDVNTTLRTAKLYPGQSLNTADDHYRLILQSDGNLVLYGNNNRPIWASGTAGRPTAFMYMQSDGNLVLYDASNRPLWDARTFGAGVSMLRLQEDGNLVIYNSAGRAVWASNTAGVQ